MEKSPFLSMSREQQRSALEAILFASDDALSPRALYKLLVEADEQAARQEQERPEAGQKADGTDSTPAGEPDGVSEPAAQKQPRQPRAKDLTGLFEALVTEINEELEATGRAFTITRVAGGYQFATTAVHGELVARLVKSKSKRRLSQAALETLAIIAYRQPITKPEIESIRGVSCNEVVNTLLEKNLVTIAGRSEAIGRPLLYGTTEEFLRAFGLHDISDLPKPRELEELMERRADILNTETVVFAENENVEEFEERLLGKTEEGDRKPEAGDEQSGEGETGTQEPEAGDGEAERPEAGNEQNEVETGIQTTETDTTTEAAEQEHAEQQDRQPEAGVPAAGEAEPERRMKAVMAVNGRS